MATSTGRRLFGLREDDPILPQSGAILALEALGYDESDLRRVYPRLRGETDQDLARDAILILGGDPAALDQLLAAVFAWQQRAGQTV